MRFNTLVLAAFAGAAAAAPLNDINSVNEYSSSLQSYAPLMRIVQLGSSLLAKKPTKKGEDSGSDSGNPAGEILSSLDSDLSDIGTTVDAFSGDASGVATIKSKAGKLLDDIKNGQGAVSSGAKIGLTDAIGLLTTFQGLSQSSSTALASIKAKKPQMDKLGITADIVSTLKEIKAQGLILNENIMQKLPGLAKGVGKSQYPPVDKAIGRTIEALSGAAPAGDAPAAAPASSE